MRFLKPLLFVVLLSVPIVTWAGYRDEFAREFMTATWAGQQGEENYCVECHISEKMKPEFIRIVEDWQGSWHAQHRISCHNCHGGDPKDASMSMSPHRGFTGKPKPAEIPEFCGKCHIGILNSYLESGHGKAFRQKGTGPQCVTCHGAHDIQKANIDIIRESFCAKCHSYDRAKTMKQALFLTEKKIGELEDRLLSLKREGVYVADDSRSLFSIQAEFRTLFHTVDVSLVKDRTDDFAAKLSAFENTISETFRELRFRKNFSAFLLLAFSGMGIVLYLLMQTPRD